MRYALACLAFVLLFSVVAFGQDCTPQVYHNLATGTPGQEIVPPVSDKVTNLVPSGYVNIVLDASIGTPQGGDPGSPVNLAIVKTHFWPDGSYWLPGWDDTPSARRETPILSWTNRAGPWNVLFERERLAARGPIGSGAMYIMYTVVAMPLSCWQRLVMAQSSTVAVGGPVQVPDYSAFIAALGVASTALQNVAQAVP